MSNFNLLTEIERDRERYENLIPDYKNSRIIVTLYQKYFNTTSFTDEEFRTIIRNVVPETEREQHKSYNNTIKSLCDYLVEYDSDISRYILTEYAVSFCKLLENKFLEEGKPSEIAQIIQILYNSLKVEIEKESNLVSNIKIWKENIFDIQKVKIENEYMVLKRQLKMILDEYRKHNTNEDDTILDTVRHIETQLNKIIKQNDDLKEALKLTNLIKKLFSKIEEDSPNVYDELYNYIDNIRAFFENISEKLKKIRNFAINITKRVSNFINDFQTRQSLRNMDKLITLIFKSQLNNDTGTIIFPQQLSELVSKAPFKYKPNTFVAIEKDKVECPKPPIKMLKSAQNKKVYKEQEKKRNEQKNKYDRVKYWYNYIIDDIEQKNHILYSYYFYQIIESDGLDVFINVTSYLLRKLNKNKKYQLKPVQEIIYYKNHLCIWEMSINKVIHS